MSSHWVVSQGEELWDAGPLPHHSTAYAHDFRLDEGMVSAVATATLAAAVIFSGGAAVALLAATSVSDAAIVFDSSRHLAAVLAAGTACMLLADYIPCKFLTPVVSSLGLISNANLSLPLHEAPTITECHRCTGSPAEL